MGIDAQMLIRKVPHSVVNDEWLKKISWHLCSAIGSKHFFISDGLSPDEYAVMDKKWNEAFKRHPLYPKWDATTDDVRKAYHEQIFADVGKPPRERRLAIDRTLVHYRENDDPAPGMEYRQDGDTIIAENGECLLGVSLYGRYYGKEYERGDILVYCAIAEFLELNIPGCVIWYGGDSSGIEAELFDEAKREELRNHLYSADGRKYFKNTLMNLPGDFKEKPKPCSLCPSNTYLGNRCGWGNGYAKYHCPGCGISLETRDGGKNWKKPEHDE